MTTSINPYFDKYQQACKAYVQKDYNQAVALIDEVAENLPDDPNTHLLRGHIYYVLNKYDIAKAEYHNVLDLTDDLEVISCAKEGLDNITKSQDAHEGISEESFTDDSEESINLNSNFLNSNFLNSNLEENEESEVSNTGNTGDFGDSGFNLNTWSELSLSQGEIKNPFEMVMDDAEINSNSHPSSNQSSDLNSNQNSNQNFIDPFSIPETDDFSQLENTDDSESLEIPSFLEHNQNLADDEIVSNNKDSPNKDFFGEARDGELDNLDNSPFAEFDSSIGNNLEKQSEVLNHESLAGENVELENAELENNPGFEFKNQNSEDETLFTNGNISQVEEPVTDKLPDSIDSTSQGVGELHNNHEISSSEDVSLDDLPSQVSSLNSSFDLGDKRSQSFSLDGDSSFDLEAFESAFTSQDTFTSQNNNENADATTDNGISQNSNIEFLDDFEEFDDLGDIPGFDLPGDSSFGDSQLSSGYLDTGSNISSSQPVEAKKSESKSPGNPTDIDNEAELFSINSSQEAVPIFTQTDVKLEPQVGVEQGVLAPLENAPLHKKQWLITGAVGAVSMIVVAAVTYLASNFTPPQQRESVRNTGWAMALAAGVSSAVTTGFMSSLTMRQIRRTTQDLQNQFSAVRQGNLNVQATVYSQDELGQLATGFNEMARVIFTTTNEATRKAQEQEEAKENLQRQVIRLLDDVEGAARGDLTVQAEVTADVLGAVADAFNLTIQNLRDIVQQVKVAAREVTKGSTNSETFARALSSDALRQAEELAGTLNSVQVMTDSIQRVAEAAREAEAVARDASDIALKGGEAVENTVAGILEIRETVAETTRKVKRLAESSQEISKIVALISQIASRTNLLALNASIEAARAGDAGRGFAIVADEVRQLADKSAKSLKEIEQIVLQIQSETGSVMTAMEEGTQQVIKGTKLAEEAKRSLENIIQTAKRIDTLVRSITADTVNQTDTSRAVAHVMQSVELTAQETSQEAQRVSGALQHLVGVSRDLISSVERFRVETVQSK